MAKFRFGSRNERRRFYREQRKKQDTETSTGQRLSDGKEQFVNQRRRGRS